MPDAMDFRHNVAMATRPNQNNNKGRNQPNGKKNNENTIQLTLYHRSDNNNKLNELLHINGTYLKKRRHSLERNTA